MTRYAVTELPSVPASSALSTVLVDGVLVVPFVLFVVLVWRRSRRDGRGRAAWLAVALTLAAVLACGLSQALCLEYRALREHGVDTIATLDHTTVYPVRDRNGEVTDVHFDLEIHYVVNGHACNADIDAPRSIGGPAVPGDELEVLVDPDACDIAEVGRRSQLGVPMTAVEVAGLGLVLLLIGYVLAS